MTAAPAPRPRLDVAVLGAGSIGKRHIRNLLTLGHSVVAVFDPDAGRRDEVRQMFGLPVVDNLSSALDRRANAAFVCSPTIHHVPQATQALQAGLHVFIEKPIAPTAENTETFQDLAMRSGRVVLTGCNMRFCPGLVRTKQAIAD